MLQDDSRFRAKLQSFALWAHENFSFRLLWKVQFSVEFLAGQSMAWASRVRHATGALPISRQLGLRGLCVYAKPCHRPDVFLSTCCLQSGLSGPHVICSKPAGILCHCLGGAIFLTPTLISFLRVYEIRRSVFDGGDGGENFRVDYQSGRATRSNHGDRDRGHIGSR